MYFTSFLVFVDNNFISCNLYRPLNTGNLTFLHQHNNSLTSTGNCHNISTLLRTFTHLANPIVLLILLWIIRRSCW